MLGVQGIFDERHLFYSIEAITLSCLFLFSPFIGTIKQLNPAQTLHQIHASAEKN